MDLGIHSDMSHSVSLFLEARAALQQPGESYDCIPPPDLQCHCEVTVPPPGHTEPCVAIQSGAWNPANSCSRYLLLWVTVMAPSQLCLSTRFHSETPKSPSLGDTHRCRVESVAPYNTSGMKLLTLFYSCQGAVSL